MNKKGFTALDLVILIAALCITAGIAVAIPKQEQPEPEVTEEGAFAPQIYQTSFPVDTDTSLEINVTNAIPDEDLLMDFKVSAPYVRFKQTPEALPEPPKSLIYQFLIADEPILSIDTKDSQIRFICSGIGDTGYHLDQEDFILSLVYDLHPPKLR